MDWLHTLFWILRGQVGSWLVVLLWVIGVYVFVPLEHTPMPVPGVR